VPSYQINWLPGAIGDKARLRQFLKRKNPLAAKKAGERILSAINILKAKTEVGVPSPDEGCDAFRDLYIPFGRGGYIIRCRIKQQSIFVVRVWHSREEQGGA